MKMWDHYDPLGRPGSSQTTNPVRTFTNCQTSSRPFPSASYQPRHPFHWSAGSIMSSSRS